MADVGYSPKSDQTGAAPERSKGANSDILHRRKATSLSPIAKPLNLRDLLGSTQKPRSDNRLQPSWDYRGFIQASECEARGAVGAAN
jgi:hypothetical protein